MKGVAVSGLRSGELFAGTNGLGRAVDQVFGSEPAWFCEFDAAPSKVLAFHHPDIPNFGDVTKVDWKQTPPVKILTGGFPCQDVSLAGRRKGMKDGTRSGLWSEFAKAIEEIRPDWVVIENVRGLYSARADSEVEPCPWCVGDGDDEYHLRALDAVLADLARLGFDAEWTPIRASDVGAPHGRFRVFILAWPRERTLADAGSGRGRGRTVAPGRGERTRADAQADWADPRDDRTPESLTLLPTTTAADANGSGGSNPSNVTLTDAVVRSSLGSAENVRHLLPTPVAQPSGNTPEDHLRKKPGREVVTDLAIIAENGLIESGGRLLPTPNVAMAEGGQTSRSGARKGEPLLGGIAVEQATEWGPYEAAIRRWEAFIGRPAPAPVRFDGKGGKPRLNPALCEWMMGWPAGHVTDPTIGLTRAEQLKACGNGVVTLQAIAALHELLARPGVPFLEGVAA